MQQDGMMKCDVWFRTPPYSYTDYLKLSAEGMGLCRMSANYDVKGCRLLTIYQFRSWSCRMFVDMHNGLVLDTVMVCFRLGVGVHM